MRLVACWLRKDLNSSGGLISGNDVAPGMCPCIEHRPVAHVHEHRLIRSHQSLRFRPMDWGRIWLRG